MMKKIMFLLLAVITSCEKDDPVFEASRFDCEQIIETTNTTHSKRNAVLNIMGNIVSQGVPGIMMSVHTDEDGYFSSALGKNDLANDIDIQSCDITRVGSTVKTFTAVTMLKLQEEGKLDLDDPIKEYLPQNALEKITNTDRATIRQLLDHSSGIYNYILDLKFQTASLNDFTKVWTPEELLDYARNKDSYFAPGEDVKYSNTNYIFLGMIIETVEGKPFYEVFKDKIFDPLQLNFTQFAAHDPVPDKIVRGYIDMYSNLNLINSTEYSGWDYFTADGGLISNPHDLNIFLTSLFEGSLLSEASLQEMMGWQSAKEQDTEGFVTQYGLGIFQIETDFGPAYLHSGDAIGYFASMVYFPDRKTTITWAVNANYGKIDDFAQSKDAMNRIFKAIFKN